MLKQNFKIQYLFKHLPLAPKQLLFKLAPNVYFGSTTYSYAQEMILKYLEKNLLGNKIKSLLKLWLFDIVKFNEPAIKYILG